MNKIIYSLIATMLFIQTHNHYAAEVSQPAINDVYTRSLIVQAKNGDSLELSPADLAALRSEYLKQLALPEHELSVESIAALPIATVHPLQLLLPESQLAEAHYDDVVEATSLADLLMIPNGVDHFLKRLGRENIKLLCQLYQDPHLEGRELVKEYISPYIGYKLTQRLGAVRNTDDHPDIGHTNWVLSVVLSPDGNTIISGSADDTLIVWHHGEDGLFYRAQRLGAVGNTDPDVGHISSVTSVALSSDGNTIISGSYDRTIIIWHRGEDGQFGFDPQRDRLGAVDNEDAVIGHTDWVTSIALSPDGNTIISGSEDHTLIVWRRDEDGLFHMAQRLGAVDNTGDHPDVGHTDFVNLVALSPDGDRIVSGSADRTAIVWHRGEDGQFRFDSQRDRLGAVGNEDAAIGHTSVVRSVVLSPDGNTIISGSYDHTIIMWHRGEDGLFHMAQRLGVVSNEGAAIGHTNWMSSVALSPDGDRIVSGSADRTAIVWHRGEDGQFRFDSQRDRLGAVGNRNHDVGHTGIVASVALSPDGNTIISSSYDRTALVWQKQSVDEFCVAQIANNGPQASEVGI